MTWFVLAAVACFFLPLWVILTCLLFRHSVLKITRHKEKHGQRRIGSNQRLPAARL